MTIHRPASHKPPWWRPKAAILTTATAAIALATVPAFAAVSLGRDCRFARLMLRPVQCAVQWTVQGRP